MRELTLTPNQIMHPETVNGRRLWIDPAVKDIIGKIQNGDPTIGWEGDPRLAVYLGEGNRWEVWRLEADGEYRLVCRSLANAKLDESVIFHLRAHDLRKQKAQDLLKAIDEHNERNVREKNQAAYEASMEGLAKTYYYLAKEIGHHY